MRTIRKTGTDGTNGTGYSEKFSVKVVYGWVRKWVPSVPYLHVTAEETSPGVCLTGGTHKSHEEGGDFYCSGISMETLLYSLSSRLIAGICYRIRCQELYRTHYSFV